MYNNIFKYIRRLYMDNKKHISIVDKLFIKPIIDSNLILNMKKINAYKEKLYELFKKYLKNIKKRSIEIKQLIYDTIEWILIELKYLLQDDNVFENNIINVNDKNYHIINEINETIYKNFCKIIFNKKNYDYILF